MTTLPYLRLNLFLLECVGSLSVPQTFKGRVLAVHDDGFIPRGVPLRHAIKPSQIVKIFVLINKMMEKM